MSSHEHSEGHGYGGKSDSLVCCGRPHAKPCGRGDGVFNGIREARPVAEVWLFLGGVLTSLTVERRRGDKGLCDDEPGFSPKLRRGLRGLIGLDSNLLGLGNVILARLPLPPGVGDNDGRRSGQSEDRMLLEVDGWNGGNDSNVCDL